MKVFVLPDEFVRKLDYILDSYKSDFGHSTDRLAVLFACIDVVYDATCSTRKETINDN